MNWSEALEALVPLGVVTVTSTGPTALAGVVAVIRVELLTVKLADVVPNLTADALVKFVPVMVAEVPPFAWPEVGFTDMTVGAGVVTSKALLMVERLMTELRARFAVSVSPDSAAATGVFAKETPIPAREGYSVLSLK